MQIGLWLFTQFVFTSKDPNLSRLQISTKSEPVIIRHFISRHFRPNILKSLDFSRNPIWHDKSPTNKLRLGWTFCTQKHWNNLLKRSKQNTVFLCSPVCIASLVYILAYLWDCKWKPLRDFRHCIISAPACCLLQEKPSAKTLEWSQQLLVERKLKSRHIITINWIITIWFLSFVYTIVNTLFSYNWQKSALCSISLWEKLFLPTVNLKQNA